MGLYTIIIIGIERDFPVNRVLTEVDIEKQKAKEVKTTSYFTHIPAGQGAQSSVLTDNDVKKEVQGSFISPVEESSL